MTVRQLWKNHPLSMCAPYRSAHLHRNRYLALAGRTEPLFADHAVARLHKVSPGLPRALNNAAIAALIAAATAGKALVDDDCAKRPWPSSLANKPRQQGAPG
jgi:hypothetical protein